jgi:hypothetical protein
MRGLGYDKPRPLLPGQGLPFTVRGPIYCLSAGPTHVWLKLSAYGFP